MQKDLNLCALSLKDINKDYGEQDFKVKALKHINLNFRKNEFVSILGPSGCGKTTLLNIIGGLDRYTSGDLIIEGRSTKKYSDKDWDAYRNNCIGFVFQSYNLIPHQTILGNVELALELSGVNKKDRREKAIKMLERVGLKKEIHKKPNQLSGGQMQRVAIARALVNDPEIILADEPTGALDTETSIQIMDLLKEVAKDKLVIMVTHNPELATKYSTRIISLLDGEKVGDTNPFDNAESEEPKTMRKPKMGFKTAFVLSLKNLISKRARTILTSIAGSIGIIGVALVLALSNGFNIYMSRMQTDTLSTYPLTISESSVDLSSFSEIYENSVKEKYPELDNILVEKAFSKLTGMLKTNNLKDDSDSGFTSYLQKMDSSLYYSISYDYGFDMNDYIYTDISLNDEKMYSSIDYVVNKIESKYEAKLNSAMGLSTSFVRQYIPTLIEMPDRDLILEQYDVLEGNVYEVNENNLNKIYLVVDEYNGLPDITLMLLGYLDGQEDAQSLEYSFSRNGQETTEISLQDMLGKKFYLANNDLMFEKESDDHYKTKNYDIGSNLVEEGFTELEIAGILRCKERVDGILDTGIVYSKALTEKVIGDNFNSEIVNETKGNKITVPIYGELEDYIYVDNTLTTLRSLAGVNTPSNISIFAKNFDCKEKVKDYLNAWNNGKEESDPNYIVYSDMMDMMFGMLNTMVDAVTYVLVAFTSISLIVSSVMIGIITYISVVERTKEIGVLRALGASKGEISNVFNAETFLIGLFAGLIGVGFTYLVSIPINIIMKNLVPQVGKLALLAPTSAVILVIISIGLTLIAGLIPSRIASKKDPVVALRSE